MPPSLHAPGMSAGVPTLPRALGDTQRRASPGAPGTRSPIVKLLNLGRKLRGGGEMEGKGGLP